MDYMGQRVVLQIVGRRTDGTIFEEGQSRSVGKEEEQYKTYRAEDWREEKEVKVQVASTKTNSTKQ